MLVAAAAGLCSRCCNSPMGRLASQVGGRFASIGRVIGGLATPDNGGYWIVFAGLITAFTYVCNFARTWEPFGDGVPVVEYMMQRGAFIPGVRPGGDTERYLTRMTARVTLPDALGLVLLASALPYAILAITGNNLIVLGLSLLVMVQTLIDVHTRIDAFESIESYDSFIKGVKRTA